MQNILSLNTQIVSIIRPLTRLEGDGRSVRFGVYVTSNTNQQSIIASNKTARKLCLYS